jgi:hypothetical protein
VELKVEVYQLTWEYFNIIITDTTKLLNISKAVSEIHTCALLVV